jgi:hypothetical protein
MSSSATKMQSADLSRSMSDIAQNAPILRARFYESASKIVEADMAYRKVQQGSSRLSGGSTLFMLLVIMVAAASNTLATRHRPAPALEAANRPVIHEHRWTPAEVRELIATIEHAEKLGLDPASYGLAALRSELDQSMTIWGRGGSRQLDTLAQTSALALANDVRLQTGTQTASAKDLDAALNAGQLPVWLTQPDYMEEPK